MQVLPDIVADHPRLLLVGINPGLRSAEIGHSFAGRGNPFWRLLHAAGLTPVVLRPEEDGRLAEFGIALTNLCPRPTRSAAELTRAELAAAVPVLEAKCAAWKPAVVALVGVTLYGTVFRVAKTGGAGPKPETLGGAAVFVVPNPSGLNQAYPGFESKRVWFRALRDYVDERTAASTDGHISSAQRS